MPKISIITINYNNLVGLKRTLTSVINQTWDEFEFIVVDGGSTDGSVEFIESKSLNIDCWLSEADNGIYNAMNKGIKVSTGEYLLFLNSGDELYDLTILEKNNKYIHTEDLIYFDIFMVYHDKSEIFQYPELLSYKTFLEGSIGHPTTFIKRTLFNKVGFYDENLKIVSDWKFFMMATVKYNCSSKKISTILSKYYMDGISSIDIDCVNEEREKVLKECFYEYYRLLELELFLKNIKQSKTIKFLEKLGLLKFIDKIN